MKSNDRSRSDLALAARLGHDRASAVYALRRARPFHHGSPMIRRETDPTLVNRIANMPEVKPFFTLADADVDLSPLFWGGRNEGRRVYVLSNGEDAAGLFEATTEGVYQSHTMFAKTCRGRRAIDTARQMVDQMFANGAEIVWGATPRNNRAARWFNRQIGAKVIGGDEEAEVFEIRKVH